MTYTQDDAERILLQLFCDDPRYATKPGSILDIGAFDGKTYSNSLALIERGWSAVLIEPSPSSFLKLLELHGQNPNVKLINAAMGIENQLVWFSEFADDMCGTLNKDNAELWAKTGRPMRKYLVPQFTPEMLVNQIAGGYDVISLDVEGLSFDLLLRLPLRAWNPRVIIVEHDNRCVEIATKFGPGFDVRMLSAENLMLVRK